MDTTALTNCELCHTLLKNPKALHCLHSFCFECIKTFVENRPKSSALRCPTCHKDTILSEPNNIDDLADNFFVKPLLEKSQPQLQLTCTGCGKEGRIAVGRCLDCPDFLCQKCWESHTEMRVFQTHKLCTMEEIRNGSAVGFGQKETSQVLWFYCKTCGVEHSQADHDYVLMLKREESNGPILGENGEQHLTIPSPTHSPVTTLERRRKDVGIWLLQREFGKEGLGQLQRGAGIAICPNGDIAVADKNASQVKIYSSDGLYKHSLNSKQVQSNTSSKKAISLPSSTSPARRQISHDVPSSPHNVAINELGEYFVTDLSHFVKVFDAQGIYKYHFPAVSTQGEKSDTKDVPLEGLTLDKKGNILIGANGNTDWFISKHNQDGTHTESINVRIRPSYLSTLTDGKIIVSSQKGVQVLDPSGQLLHTLHAPPGVTLWNTAGVCATKGIIFVANYLGDSMAIYCFSVTGKFLGCATREVRSPKGLAITAEGKKLLVVDTNGKSVKEFNLMQAQ